MKKTLLIIFSLFAAMPTALMAAPLGETAEVPAIEQTAALSSNIAIRQDGSRLVVSGAEGLQLQVFSMTGKHVGTYEITSASWTVRLSLPHGWYILRVGDVVRKIAL